MDYLNLSAANANGSSVIQQSPLDTNLIDSYRSNRSIQNPAYAILIVMYGSLIVLGTVGNILVVLAVVRKPSMRTARNMFIVNLAVSDLVLCIVTMPLTLMEILAKFWPLGNYASLCKMIGTLQATSIFVSTISITSIALDRYQVIVYPTRDNLQCMGAALILVGIWLFALLLASPMVLFKRLAQFHVKLTAYGIQDVAFCVEDWPIRYGRAYYSAFSLFFQYLLPILIVSIAYSSIYGKLRSRIQIGGTAVHAVADDSVRERKAQRSRRMRRTNCLLVSIAVIFGVSWLPLNLYNLVSDVYLTESANTQPLLITYAVCHMMGMSSACSNPFMYGWLNDNFRKEFREILCLEPLGVCLVTTNTNSNERAALARRNGAKVAQSNGATGSSAAEAAAAAAAADATLLNERSKIGSDACTENAMSTEMTVLVR